MKKVLKQSLPFQLHRDLQEQFEKRSTQATCFAERVEGDLGDLGAKVAPEVSKELPRGRRKQLRFLLLVDAFSGKMWGRGLKSQSGEEVAAALKDIFDGLKPPYKWPEVLETDAGREFVCRPVAEVCKAHGTRQKIATGVHKARRAERAMRSLKRVIMASYQSGRWPQDKTWDEVVRLACKTLNGRYNRALGMAPDDVPKHFLEVNARAWQKKKFTPVTQYVEDERALQQGRSIRGKDGRSWKLGQPVLTPIPKQRRAEMRDKEFQIHYRFPPMVIAQIYHARQPYLFRLKHARNGKVDSKVYYSHELRQVFLPPNVKASEILALRAEQGRGMEAELAHKGWIPLP